MSTITNVIMQWDGLTFGHTNDPDGDGANYPRIQEIVRHLTGQRFGRITDSPGSDAWGGHAPECDIIAGAFNNFPIDEFFEAVERLTWTRPDTVRVIVQRSERRAFGVWVLCDGKMVCVLAEVAW